MARAEIYDPRTGEVWNKVRAGWAENAIDAGSVTFGGRNFETLLEESRAEGDDAYCAVKDLINNLLHLAHLQGWSVDELLESAKRSFDDELEIESQSGKETNV